MKETQQVAYTPRREFNCGFSEGSTHYQGCQCHEAAWALKLRESEAKREKLREEIEHIIGNEDRRHACCHEAFKQGLLDNHCVDVGEKALAADSGKE